MSDPRRVISKEGLRGTIVDGPRADTRQVAVLFEDGRTALVPLDFLERYADGSYRLAVSLADLQEAAAAPSTEGRIVAPAIEETVEVGRRQVAGDTVRVRKRVSERDAQVDEPVMSDEVQVERIPIGQMISSPPEARREGDTVIIPVLEEVLVVEKRLMLKEEVHITRRRVERRHTDQVHLRKEEVVVERIPPAHKPRRDEPGSAG